MIKKENSEIIDFILTDLKSKNGEGGLNDLKKELLNKSFRGLAVNSSIDLLFDELHLLKHIGNSDTWIKLTLEGEKAAKWGIDKYLEKKEQNEQLDKDSKKASIKGVRNAKIFSIVAISISIGTLIFKPQIDNIFNRNDQSNTREKIGNSNVPLQLSDTLFIKEIKNSLKHDTAFLNEIVELNKNQKEKKN